MIWQELVKTALLGLENGQLSPAILEALKTQSINTNAEPAAVLLEGASVFWQMQKAGFLIPDFSGGMPSPVQERKERFCSTQAGFHLELMFNGFYKKALPEFFYLLRQARQTLLPELLPALFRASIRNKALWNMAQGHIGEHGKWLLQQNPDWRILMKRTIEKPETFEYLDASKDSEEFIYRCHPDKLKELMDYYEQHTIRWDWQTENMHKVATFRANLLNAFVI